MIPESITLKVNESEVQPSLTFGVDFVNKKISGKVDEFEAVFQAIEKILSTAKYANVIYDWYYGNEIQNLVGKDFSFVETELPRIVEEAVLQDDRVKSVSDFSIKRVDSETLEAVFHISTIFGDTEFRKEVAI